MITFAIYGEVELYLDSKAVKEYCLSKPGATEDFPFGPDVLVIKVGSKMFALVSGRENRINLSLKCDPFVAEDLRQRYPAVTAGYHLNKKHWNTVVIDGSVPDNELAWMIDHSYELVIKSLSQAVKESLFE
jgi:predicted DNA-binding protein (MmcQ/YjbR family)